MQQKSFIYSNANIHYQVVGIGKTVVLLHGFGEDGSIWNLQIAALKHEYRLIIPDIPGSGQSDLVTNATIETYAGIIKALLEIELPTTQTCTMIGHSMGGYIALAFAAAYPNLLNGLGLVHSTAFEDSSEKKEMRSKAITFIENKGAYSFLRTSIAGLFNETFWADNKQAMDELIEKSKSFSTAALVQYYQAMINRPERIAVLKTFLKPVLFIIGEHDKAVPLDSSLAQCYLPAISHVHILKKSAHMGMIEETEKVNRLLNNFLEQV